MTDDFGGADGPHDEAVMQRTTFGLATQEPGSEQIARARCIDDLGDRFSGHRSEERRVGKEC